MAIASAAIALHAGLILATTQNAPHVDRYSALYFWGITSILRHLYALQPPSIDKHVHSAKSNTDVFDLWFQKFYDAPMVNIQIQSSLLKLFPEAYSNRKEEVLADEKNQEAVKK